MKTWFSRNLKKVISRIMVMFGAISDDIDEIEDALGDMTTTVVQTSLLAANWSNGEYSFESTYPAATYKHVVMDFNYDTGTDAQREAYILADICPSKTANKVYLKGTKPSIDIPIILKIRRAQ